MFCPRCGQKIENENAKFCPKCGQKLIAFSANITDESTPQASPGESQPQSCVAQKGNSLAGKVVVLIFLMIVLAAAAGIWFLMSGKKQKPSSAIPSDSQRQEIILPSASPTLPPIPTPSATSAPTPVPTQTPTLLPTPTAAPQMTPVLEESEYILPHSDTEPVTTDQLKGLSAEEARIARNEILARHGRRFNDQQLQAHFDSCSWYKGTVDANSFDYNVLSALEQQNVEVIKEYEASLAQ